MHTTGEHNSDPVPHKNIVSYQLEEIHKKDGIQSNNPFIEDVSFKGVLPIMAPSFNLSPLVNKSELLQIMLNLGVSIHKWEKKDVHSWIMTLDLKKNIFPILQFLTDQGFSNESLGKFLTKNPYIFKTSPEELEARTQYLLSKKFDSNMIHRIVSRNPMWYQFR